MRSSRSRTHRSIAALSSKPSHSSFLVRAKTCVMAHTASFGAVPGAQVVLGDVKSFATPQPSTSTSAKLHESR